MNKTGSRLGFSSTILEILNCDCDCDRGRGRGRGRDRDRDRDIESIRVQNATAYATISAS